MITTIKRSANTIFDKGGFLREILNFGPRDLPYKISSNGVVHKTGSSFVLKFVVDPESIKDLDDEFNRDVDIIRKRIFKVDEPKRVPCTLEEELQPPAYRKEVIELMEVAKRKEKKKYSHNTGLKYYPFQR